MENSKCNKHTTFRENMGDQVEIGFIFASDWLRDKFVFSGPITEQSETIKAIMDYFSTSMKIFLCNQMEGLILETPAFQNLLL